MSKLSSDFRDLEIAGDNGDELAKTALETFVYKVAKYVGSYVAAMNGVDIIAFTAGVGENDGVSRAKVASYLEFLGIKIDSEKNKSRGKEVIISTSDSKVAVMVVPTNEELAIARETLRLLKD